MSLEPFDGVKNILISDCIVDENNLYQMRQQYKPEIISAIKTSLENGKLFQPIAVTLSEDKEHYIIVDGTHRFKAASELGWKEIQATYLNEDEAKQWGLTANILRNDYNAVEKSNALVKLKEKLKIENDKDLAALVGLDPSTTSKYIKINSLPNFIKENAVKVDYFSYQKLYALAKDKSLTEREKILKFDRMIEEYDETTGKKKHKPRAKKNEQSQEQGLKNIFALLDNAIPNLKDNIDSYLNNFVVDDEYKAKIVARYKRINSEYAGLKKLIEEMNASENVENEASN